MMDGETLPTPAPAEEPEATGRLPQEPPRPELAALAVSEALGDGGAPPEEPKPAPAPARRQERRERGKRRGPRSAADLRGENRELRERLEAKAEEPAPPVAPAAPPPPEVLESAGELCGLVCGIIFRGLAAERGEHWALKEEEAAQIKKWGGRALGPHMDKIGDVFPWVMLGTTLAGAVQVRVRQDKRIRSGKERLGDETAAS